MKILIVSTFDQEGGAARAAHRLHSGLLSENIESQMLVQHREKDDLLINGPETLYERITAKIRHRLERFPQKLKKKRTKTYFSYCNPPFSKSVINQINRIKPDIVHLHWIGCGMINLELLKYINAPIVWTLHDNWAFTGGCHTMWDCTRYQSICGMCHVLHSNSKKDVSTHQFNKKLNALKNINSLTIIALSHWLADCAKKSLILNKKKIICLPNPIDTQKFKPIDKKVARNLCQLPENKKLILSGAIGIDHDPNKGYEHFFKAIEKLNIQDTEIVLTGTLKQDSRLSKFFKCHYMGRLTDDISLIALYNSCDIMVVPSIQENLSNSIMESLSCGTPVVGFDIGGNSDMVDHMQNGYLANPYNTDDLASGINWVLDKSVYSNDLNNNARIKVVNNFDQKSVIKKYIQIYKSLGTTI